MENNTKSRQETNFLNLNQQIMVDWNNLFAEKTEKETKEEKVNKFKQRLEGFKNISTLDEAKALLRKTIPVKLERTVFFIGDAKCVIINKENRVRISLNSEKEFISYDFV